MASESWFSIYFGEAALEYTDFSSVIAAKLGVDDLVFMARLFQLVTSGQEEATQETLNESYTKFDMEGADSEDKLKALIYKIQHDNPFVEVVSLVQAFDTDGDGAISVFELPGLLETQGLEFSPKVVYAVFHELDEDASGLVSIEELSDFMWGSFIEHSHVSSQAALLELAFNSKSEEIAEQENDKEESNMVLDNAQEFLQKLEMENINKDDFVGKLATMDLRAASNTEISRMMSEHALENLDEKASEEKSKKLGKHHQSFDELGHSIDAAVYEFLKPLTGESILSNAQRFGIEIDVEDDDWVEECLEELLDEVREIYLETEKLIKSFGVNEILCADKLFQVVQFLQMNISVEQCNKIFEAIDDDDSGSIELRELAPRVLTKAKSMETFEATTLLKSVLEEVVV